MKIKALVSFVGDICMTVGEIAEVADKTATPLISCGYAEALTEREEKPNEVKRNNNSKRKTDSKD